jgi:hypothetical protein
MPGGKFCIGFSPITKCFDLHPHARYSKDVFFFSVCRLISVLQLQSMLLVEPVSVMYLNDRK